MAASPGEAHPVPDQASLTVAAVARRLGVAPTTLRTWARRYGLGPTRHEAGTHRRYGPEDVRRLEVMRRLTRQGVPAEEAARLALAGTQPAARTVVFPYALGAPSGAARPAALVRAASQLDVAAVAAHVRESLDRLGAVTTWDGLVVPTLVELGRRWERSGRGVEVEHATADAVLGALRSYQQRIAVSPTGARQVLLACAEEEQHSLPLHALSAALTERHVGCRVLGARVPREALAAAIRRTGPSAVFLWSSLRDTGDPGALNALPPVRPAPVVVLGGPGWDRARLPVGLAGLVVTDELAHAVATLADAARE